MTQQLLILCGIPFSGKTTLAKKITDKLNFKRIDLDEIKFKTYGSQVRDEEINQVGWDGIYQQMYKEIGEAFENGFSVVHDTGNFTVQERGLISSIAKKKSLPFHTIFMNIPVSLAKQRLEENRKTNKRFDISDESFLSAVREMEPPTNEENPIFYNYDQDIDEWVAKNIPSMI